MNLTNLIFSIFVTICIAHLGEVTEESLLFASSSSTVYRNCVSVQQIFDVDKNGVNDVLIGCRAGNFGGSVSSGMVALLLMNSSGVENEVLSSLYTPAYYNLGSALTWFYNETVVVSAQYKGHPIMERGGVYFVEFDDEYMIQELKFLGNGSDPAFGVNFNSAAQFGSGVKAIDDLDGDGIPELVIGGLKWNGFEGAAWIFYMNSDLTVRQYRDIIPDGGLQSQDCFGSSVALFHDLDGDGIREILIGSAYNQYSCETVWGGIYLVYLNSDGTIKKTNRIGRNSTGDHIGGFTGLTIASDRFGIDVSVINDMDGDGINEVLVSAPHANFPTLWVLFFHTNGIVYDQIPLSFNSTALQSKLFRGTTQMDNGYIAVSSQTDAYQFKLKGCDDFFTYVTMIISPLDRRLPSYLTRNAFSTILGVNATNICVVHRQSEKRQGVEQLVILIEKEEFKEQQEFVDFSANINNEFLNDIVRNIDLVNIEVNDFEFGAVAWPTEVYIYETTEEIAEESIEDIVEESTNDSSAEITHVTTDEIDNIWDHLFSDLGIVIMASALGLIIISTIVSLVFCHKKTRMKFCDSELI